MSDSEAIRLLVVDDHPVLRSGLVLMLGSEPDITIVAEGANGREAVELYRIHHPDVALLDVRMPVMDGVAAVAAIRSEFPQARIILLTAHDGDETVFRGLRAGAQGYLTKGAACAEIVDAVRTVQAGGKVIPPEVGARLAERATHDELTEREIGVLGLMCRGLTNAEIGDDLCIAEGTVKHHINRILSKLDAPDRTRAVIVALRRGLAVLE